jgi:hypothetical protein
VVGTPNRDSKLVVNRPLEILLYASRHNHVEIMDQAAEHILKNDLEVPSEVPGWVGAKAMISTVQPERMRRP